MAPARQARRIPHLSASSPESAYTALSATVCRHGGRGCEPCRSHDSNAAAHTRWSRAAGLSSRAQPCCDAIDGPSQIPTLAYT
jgi:hypothetical protein